jgi:(2Fe-2S) ferredoxin
VAEASIYDHNWRIRPQTNGEFFVIDETDAIILLGRGGYSRGPQEQMTNLVNAIQEALPQTRVVGAFVDQSEPSLPAALQEHAVAGGRQILVQPLFLPADHNLQRWLAKVIMRWYSQWQGENVAICLAESLGDQPALRKAVVEAVQQVRPYTRNIPETPPLNWEENPAGWSHLPDHAHHVFFCRGPRCTALGADQLATCLRNQLKAYKLTGDDRVLVAQSGCLCPCNHGPLMVVYPDGVWYGDLTEEAIDHIVQEHFVEGQVVNEYVRFTTFNPTIAS